ncbi:MAG: O-antigen ligase family protein [bacterium]|nr:O-antigen ligase family protein [bacterium]
MTLLVALLPSYLLRIEIIGIPTTLLECLSISLLLVWLFKRTHVWKRKRFWSTNALLPIGLLFVASTLSIVISPDIVAALGIWKAYFIEPILLFFIYKHEFRKEKLQPNNIYLALGITACIISSIGMIQWVTGNGIPIPWDIERRVTSIFNYPNAVGLFLGPITVIGLLLSNGPQKHFWRITTLLSLITIFLAESEASIVAIIGTLIVAGLWKKHTRLATFGIVVIGSLLTLISPWKDFVIEKLTLQDYSGGVRLSQWSETFNLLKDHWLFGAGLSGFQAVLEPYHLATHLEIFQYPHNIFLNFWVEIGLLGLVAVTILGYKAWQHRAHPATLIPLLALTHMFIHGLVDVPYFKNDLALLTWILLAIVFAYAGKNVSPKKIRTTKK